MRRSQVWLGVVATLAAVAASGCGGDTSKGGASLAAQFRSASAEPDAAARARKLVALAPKQYGAGDAAGGDASLGAALAAADEVTDKLIQAGLLQQIGDLYGRQGNSFDAKKTLRRARGVADEIEDVAQRVPVLARCAESLHLRAEEPDLALEILKESEQLAGSIAENPTGKGSATLRVAAAYFAIKATADAERLAAFGAELARGIEEPRARADALSEAAAIAHRVGMKEQAGELFTESIATAAKIEDPHSRGYAQLTLSNRLHTAGDKDQAAKLLAAAEKSADDTKDRGLREGLLEKIRQAGRR